MKLLGSKGQPVRRWERLRLVEPVRPVRPLRGAIPTSQLAECTCPDFCERDHDNE